MKGFILYEDKECKAERISIYVKRGPYSHGYVIGWQLVDTQGEVIVDGHPGQPRSAYEYQKPKYPTRKSILEAVEDHNYWWKKRMQRKTINPN